MKASVQQCFGQDLLVEYTRLFLGPFKTIVPPYSAIYFGSDSIMSEETLWVINFYNQLGLKFDEKIKDMQDHIAVETEFMYYMIFNEIKELQTNSRDKSHNLWLNQSQFFNKHYKKWVPKHCKKIGVGTDNKYFKALSGSLKKFVNSDSISLFPSEGS